MPCWTSAAPIFSLVQIGPATSSLFLISALPRHTITSFNSLLGRWHLHLHNKEQLKHFPTVEAVDIPGIPVELVAIYQSRIHQKTWNEEQEHYTIPINVIERYEVLWIEWKDGVAYRLANGNVGKTDWEDLDLEEVSLILG